MGCLGQVLTWPNSALLSWCPQSPWVYHFVLIPLPATSSNQVSSSAAQTLFGRGGSHWPGSLPGVLQQTWRAWGLGLQPPWSPHWSQGPYCPEAISLSSKFSVSCTIFGLLSSYMLGYCWLFALLLSTSARYFTHAQGEVDSAPTYLAAILVPHFYLSLNSKLKYAKNVTYFLPFSILKWLHKNSPILICFFICTLIQQLSQHNLTKLFRMKLKTTKCYESHLMKKKQTFWPTQ